MERFTKQNWDATTPTATPIQYVNYAGLFTNIINKINTVLILTFYYSLLQLLRVTGIVERGRHKDEN